MCRSPARPRLPLGAPLPERIATGESGMFSTPVWKASPERRIEACLPPGDSAQGNSWRSDDSAQDDERVAMAVKPHRVITTSAGSGMPTRVTEELRRGTMPLEVPYPLECPKDDCAQYIALVDAPKRGSAAATRDAMARCVGTSQTRLHVRSVAL